MKRSVFSDGVAVGLVRLVFLPLEWAVGKATGEAAEPLLDKPRKL